MNPISATAISFTLINEVGIIRDYREALLSGHNVGSRDCNPAHFSIPLNPRGNF